MTYIFPGYLAQPRLAAGGGNPSRETQQLLVLRSNLYPLDFVKREFFARAIVELGVIPVAQNVWRQVE